MTDKDFSPSKSNEDKDDFKLQAPECPIEKEKREQYSLLHARVTYKPFQYPWAYDAWKLQQQMHWMPDEVPMESDVREWNHKLSPAERHLCTQILRFFTQADVEVQNCYMTHYAGIFKPVEIKMMLAAFSNMETIHMAAYSHLIESLSMPETTYSDFMEYKEMKDKYDYMQSFKTDSKEGIALTLAAFGAFTEGVQLFASFVILLNFQRHNKMKGMGQIVTWSARDESLHTASIIKLFKTFISENKEIWTPKLRESIYDVCSHIIECEDAFIDLAFRVPEAAEDLTADQVKRYIRYIADERLVQLGLKPIYMIDKNPLEWVSIILNAQEHANFFENRATEYSKAATTGSWDDAFGAYDTETPDLPLSDEDKKKEESDES